MTNETNGNGALEVQYGKGTITIPVPKEGGLVLLRGKNEAWKSRTQDAIAAFVDPSRGGLEQHRGAEGTAEIGYVRGFGASMRFGEVTTRKGKPAAIAFDGLDVTDIIDPGIVSEDAADRARIVGLCDLLGLKGDPQLFHDLLGGEEAFKQIADADVTSQKSLPDMAAALKTKVDRKALESERTAERFEGEANGYRLAIGDVDLKAPANETALTAATEQRAVELARLEGRKAEAANTRASLNAAHATLERLRAQPQRDEAELQRELETAQAEHAEANRVLGSATEAVLAAEAAKAEAIRQADLAIANARSRALDAGRGLSSAHTAMRSAEQRLEAARAHAKELAKAENDAKATGVSIVPPPTDEEIAAAQASLESARAAQKLGVLVRKAREQALLAEKATENAAKWRTYADNLRDAAGNIGSVLTRALAPILPEGMSIEGNRIKQKQGANTFFFSRLSMGERTSIVLTAAARALDKQAEAWSKRTGLPAPAKVLVIDQEFAESLDREHQKQLDALCKELRVIVYGAVCDEGELRAVPFVDDPHSLDESQIRGASEFERNAIAQAYAARGTNGNGAHS